MSISSAPSGATQAGIESRTKGNAIWFQSLRAVTGLYILAYVTLHLLNLALGLISLEAMEAARPALSSFWTGPVTGKVLMLALAIHYFLGLWGIYTRPRISGTMQDLVQALSGLLVIPLMATHIVGTSMLKTANVDVGYTEINQVFWLTNPGVGLTQVLMITVVWIHGCAGFFTWLRAREAAAAWLPWLYPLAVAIPVFALLGYTQAGRMVLAAGVGPQFEQLPLADGSTPEAINYALIKSVTFWTIWVSAGLALLVLAARGIRLWLAQPARILLNTQDVGSFEAQTGQTLLDAFRTEGQPHPNLCSGRGRCGTCAVRILSGAQDLPPIGPIEAATLERVAHGPDARLACQLHLERGGTLDVARILPPDYTFESAKEEKPDSPAEATT